jgi:hypothetical protein
MFAKANLLLCLCLSPLVSAQQAKHKALPVAPLRPQLQHVVAAAATRRIVVVEDAHQVGARDAAARTTVRRRRHVYRAAARAVERKLLSVAPRSRLLARFVDRSTGLVKLNVTAHCELMRGRHRRHSVYLCRVWRQPHRPSSGIRVRCRTKHKRFVVLAYRHRRLR